MSRRGCSSGFTRLTRRCPTMSRRDYSCELGLSSTVCWRSPCSVVDSNDQEMMRSRRQDQIVELKKRSNNRMAQKKGSWDLRRD
ncbi:hypothetical protein NL676_015994 [Syzygium grande]|nr:hypothetical protein NL676_015994 [Syzygium grande]